MNNTGWADTKNYLYAFLVVDAALGETVQQQKQKTAAAKAAAAEANGAPATPFPCHQS